MGHKKGDTVTVVEDTQRKMEDAYEEFRKKFERAQTEGGDTQKVSSTLQYNLVPALERIEKRVIEKLALYDDGINSATRIANAAHVAVAQAKRDVVLVIKTTGWIVGFLAALASILSLLALLVR